MQRINAPYLFILITLMIDGIGIAIVFPIMPDLMERVGANGGAEGALWAGLLMSAYAGAQFLFAPVVGSLSDAHGRKPILLAALGFMAIDYVIMALAGSYWLLLFGRIMTGLAGATYTTATAYIADITPKKDRAARFGMIGAAFGIGFILGPTLGGIAAGWHVTAPFWVASALASLNFLFGIFVLPESLRQENRRPFGRRDLNPFAIIGQAFRVPALTIPLMCLFLFEFANIVYPTLWAFWGREVFGWSNLIIGLSLSAYGLLTVGVQAGIMPFAIKRLRERRLAITGLVVGSIALFGISITTAIWAVVVLLPLAAMSDLVPPTLTAIAANETDEDSQGMVQGVIAAMSSIAAVLAPLVFTTIFRVFTEEGAAYYLPGAPFLLAGVIVMSLVPIVARLKG